MHFRSISEKLERLFNYFKQHEGRTLPPHISHKRKAIEKTMKTNLLEVAQMISKLE